MDYIYTYLGFFIAYSFLGWCVEVAYAAVTTGEFVNRGFLNGPFCPVYGFGVSFVIALLSPIKENKLLLFLGAMLVTSTLEYVTGWLLEKLFKQRWWDYSQFPFNLGGYICLKFSLVWGLSCLLVLDVLQPSLAYLIALIPIPFGWGLLIGFCGLLAIDAIATAQSIFRLNLQLTEIHKIAGKIRNLSDDIGERISSDSLAIADKLEDIQESGETIRASIREDLQSWRSKEESSLPQGKSQLSLLLEQRERLLGPRSAIHARLIKAFPHLRSLDYKEELEQLRQKISGKK